METSLVSKTKSDITKVDAKEFNINEFQIGQNLYIDASAGTGKTYTIQQIVAKMVGAGIKLPSILIVTYTDKAVGNTLTISMAMPSLLQDDWLEQLLCVCLP